MESLSGVNKNSSFELMQSMNGQMGIQSAFEKTEWVLCSEPPDQLR